MGKKTTTTKSRIQVNRAAKPATIKSHIRPAHHGEAVYYGEKEAGNPPTLEVAEVVPVGN